MFKQLNNNCLFIATIIRKKSFGQGFFFLYDNADNLKRKVYRTWREQLPHPPGRGSTETAYCGINCQHTELFQVVSLWYLECIDQVFIFSGYMISKFISKGKPVNGSHMVVYQIVWMAHHEVIYRQCVGVQKTKRNVFWLKW